MTMITKEKIKRVLYFLEDEISAHAQSPDEKIVPLRIPVRRLLGKIATSSKEDLLTIFRKLRSDDVLRLKDIGDLEKNGHTTALDNVAIEIDAPKFFEYKKLILGEGQKPASAAPKPEDNSESKNNRPHCITEGKWGYLKFGKYGEKIKIGGSESRHFRLLQCLLEPLGSAKSIEAVFDSIRLPKDKNDSDLSGYDAYRRKGRQITLIENTIKELQKENKMRGKLKFEFDDPKNKLWIKYIG